MAVLTKVCDFNLCYKNLDFRSCIERLQSLEFCADYCAFIFNLLEIDGNFANSGIESIATWQDLLIFDNVFHQCYHLEWYNQKAANFFGFKFVGHFDNQPVCYQNALFDCAWRVPNPRPNSTHINGNAYMINPKQGKPLHYFLNEWAKQLVQQIKPLSNSL